MERTPESDFLDNITRECIEYAIEFECDLDVALDDLASDMVGAGFPLTERQINLIRERLSNVEI